MAMAYDKEEIIYNEVKKYKLEGEKYGLSIEELYLDKSNRDRIFALGSVYTVKNSKHVQKIYIFEWKENKLDLIWNSTYFEGGICTITFDDADNNGKRNINAITHSDGIGYSCVMFDWDFENTKKVYPDEQGALPIIKGTHIIRMHDGDKDGLVEIYTRIINETEAREIVYLLKENKLVVEKEKITKLPLTKKIKDIDIKPKNTLADNYPLIDELVKSKYVDVELKEVYQLRYDKLYLVTFTTKEVNGDYHKSIILEKQEDNYIYWYEFESKYDGYYYYRNAAEAQDINGDGYLELFLIQPNYSMSDSYYYIFTLNPEGYKLISPLNEEGLSMIWTSFIFGNLIIWDFNGDGKKDIECSHSDISGYGRACQCWLWSESLQQFVKDKVTAWDEDIDDYVEIIFND